MNRFFVTLLFALLAFQSSPVARGQDVPVPDAGLKLAIWIALDEHWPDAGTLKVAHMLRLTDLDASHSDVKSLQGLEAAHNLTFLSLAANHLSTLSLPSGLSLLRTLDLSENVLTNLNLAGNLLQTIVVPQSLVEGSLKNSMSALEKAGVQVLSYPAVSTLIARPTARSSDLQLDLNGPPGVYQLQTTPDLTSWHTVNRVTNASGLISVPTSIEGSGPAGFFRVITSD